MSDVQKYMLLVDNDKTAALATAQQTAQGMICGGNADVKVSAYKTTDLETNRVTLINVVQSLGEYINDESLTIRSKAVQYLAQVIDQLSSTFLSRQQVQVLCQFLCDRIEDGGAVGGLKTLQGMTRFNKDMAAMTFRA